MPGPTFIDRILTHRRGVLAIYGILALAALPGLFQLEQDNSAEVFFVEDAVELERHRRFQMDFGRDRLVRLVVEGENLWTAEGLSWLGAVERQARELRGVFGGAGLFQRFRKHLGTWPPEKPAAFREEAHRDPLSRAAGWITEDDMATVLVALYNLPPDEEGRLLAELQALLDTAPSGLATSMVGLPVLERAFDRELVQFVTRVFPFLLALASILLWLALRNLGDVARLLVFVAVVLGLVLGAIGGVGLRLNMISILLVPLLFVISLATAVHVLLRFRQHGHRGLDPREAVRATYREKGWPVFWTGVTTLAGFGSLAVSDVPPVRSLGLWTAAGIALLTVAAFTLYPALLTGARNAPGAPGRFEAVSTRWGRRAARWSTRRRRRVVLGFALVALVGVGGFLHLRPETAVLSYLPPEHPVRSELEELEAQGVGMVTAELVLSSRNAADPAPFRSTAALERVGKLADELRQIPGVLGVLSAGDLLESTRARHPGEDPLVRVLEDAESRDFLATLRTRDGSKARVAVLIPMAGFQNLEPVFEQIRRRARASFPEMEITRTGRYPLVLAAQRTLFESMVLSLLLTLSVVAGTFLLVLESPKLGLTALVPNLWPVVCVLGAMGWLGVPVDSSTLMIAAVVLGLAVDDTFHTFGRFRLESGASSRRAVATLEDVAPAHGLSSTLLALGFGLCAVSGLLPVARFGALAAWGIASALAADLFLVPALLSAVSTPTPGAGTTGSSGRGEPPAGSRPRSRGSEWPGSTAAKPRSSCRR